MVRTLSNAFDLDRIHQAYLLTGVRGVGKTTTARILARAFNYELPARDGQPRIDRPTIHMPELGVHCQAIIESRHVDVIEMDAASHTGIDDMREIIESARYRPVMARTKVYIIDEVHMLSKAGLQRPAEDARRAAGACEVPVRHDRDRQGAGDGALALPALRPAPHRGRRAGRAISPASAPRKASPIEHGGAGPDRARRRRLGARRAVAARPGDRAWRRRGAARSTRRRCAPCSASPTARRIIDLFEAVMKGDMARRARRCSRTSTTSGADPGAGAGRPRRIRASRHAAEARARRRDAMPARDRRRSARAGQAFAQAARMAVLTRAWQMLLKGMQDVQAIRRGRSPPPTWCWCASPMRPTCRRRTRRCASSPQQGGTRGGRARATSGSARGGASAAGGSAAARRSRRHRRRLRERAAGRAQRGTAPQPSRACASQRLRGPRRAGAGQPRHPAQDRARARRPPRALRGQARSSSRSRPAPRRSSPQT